MRLKPTDLKAVVAIPTSPSRRPQPSRPTGAGLHRDAAFNVGRSGLLLGALATGDTTSCASPCRTGCTSPPLPLVPGLEDVIEAARARRLRCLPLRLGPDRPPP